ncbi:hypothetical protein R5R35_002871 [Gryllus longicercus]|uniref:Uncharacterized protein n=1 Tax=Gryllus longicercus TaxID=2509291 RepID=A0AAN9VK81_9ORTH
MKCSYACVVCVLSFIAGFLCLLTSAAVVIFAIWIWVTHDCVLDPEGIYVFQIIRAITVTLLVLLSVETIASGLLLAGIIKKNQLWIQFWIWYHSAVTALIAVTVASVERTHSVILYILFIV